MNDSSSNVKPNISSTLMTEGDPRVVDLLKELDKMHGAAIVVQDDRGRLIPIRVNTQSSTLEAFTSNKWQSVSADKPQGNTTSSGFDLVSSGGRVLVTPLVLKDSLRIDGNVGFYGTNPVAKTVVADPAAMVITNGEIAGVTINSALNDIAIDNGEIALVTINQAVDTLSMSSGVISALPISAVYDAAEVQALRGACETLAQDVIAVNAAAARKASVEALRDKLETLGDDVRDVNAAAARKADVESERDKCETLSDDVRALHSTVTALIDALQDKGLI